MSASVAQGGDDVNFRFLHWRREFAWNFDLVDLVGGPTNQFTELCCVTSMKYRKVSNIAVSKKVDKNKEIKEVSLTQHGTADISHIFKEGDPHPHPPGTPKTPQPLVYMLCKFKHKHKSLNFVLLRAKSLTFWRTERRSKVRRFRHKSCQWSYSVLFPSKQKRTNFFVRLCECET